MKVGAGFGVVALCLAGAVFPIWAHHSHGQYEDTFMDIEGAVKEVHLVVPHSWIYLDVKNPDGATLRWSVETGSTNALFRRGWRKESLRAGDHITIDAFRAKDGSNTANASTVKLPDGRQVSAASSRDSK